MHGEAARGSVIVYCVWCAAGDASKTSERMVEKSTNDSKAFMRKCQSSLTESPAAQPPIIV